MADVSQDLGSRIVQAARLAVAMHLAQSCSSVDSTGRTNATVGGADPRVLTDGQSPLMTGERPRRSAPSASPLSLSSFRRGLLGESEAA